MNTNFERVAKTVHEELGGQSDRGRGLETEGYKELVELILNLKKESIKKRRDDYECYYEKCVWNRRVK